MHVFLLKNVSAKMLALGIDIKTKSADQIASALKSRIANMRQFTYSRIADTLSIEVEEIQVDVDKRKTMKNLIKKLGDIKRHDCLDR